MISFSAIKKLTDKGIELVNRINTLLPDYPRLPRWSEHLMFWCFIGYTTFGQFARQFAPTALLTPNPAGHYVIWANQLIISILSFWALGYYVLPRFWYKGKPLQTLFFLALYWFVSCYQTEVVFDLVSTYLGPAPKYLTARLTLFRENSWVGYYTNSSLFWFNWAHNFSYVIIPLLIKAKRDEKARAGRMAALEQDKLHMELNFLRSQINPHFLFNAFNNLYSLIRRSDTMAASILADLSDVMRYALYRTKTDYVSLRGEIRFINNYLRLEGIRFSQSRQISYEVEGEPGQFGIPPMVIVTFIENAFKHGLNSSIQRGFLTVRLTIDAVNKRLTVNIINSKEPGYTHDGEGGVGIANVRKRLDLLYGSDYDLNLEDQLNAYVVALVLPLKTIPPVRTDAHYEEDEELLVPYQLHSSAQPLTRQPA